MSTINWKYKIIDQRDSKFDSNLLTKKKITKENKTLTKRIRIKNASKKAAEQILRGTAQNTMR